MDIRQSTLVIVETINEGKESERVTLRRIALDDTAFSVATDEAHIDVYHSQDDVPAVLVEVNTRS